MECRDEIAVGVLHRKRSGGSRDGFFAGNTPPSNSAPAWCCRSLNRDGKQSGFARVKPSRPRTVERASRSNTSNPEGSPLRPFHAAGGVSPWIRRSTSVCRRGRKEGMGNQSGGFSRLWGYAESGRGRNHNRTRGSCARTWPRSRGRAGESGSFSTPTRRRNPERQPCPRGAGPRADELRAASF